MRLQRLAQAEHARAAELNAVISAMGEAVVVCGADGTISLANPAAHRLFPEVDERSYADILAELHDPTEAAPRLRIRRRTGRAADPPRPRPLGRDRHLPGQRHARPRHERRRDHRRDARRDRGASSRGRPRDVHRHPVARAAHAGDDDLRRCQAPRPRARRRSTRRRSAGSSSDIHSEAERLQRLVEDVVALNRFGEGPGEIGLGAGPLPAARAARGRVGAGSLAGRDVRARRSQPGLPTVSADPTYVEQVIRNLLSNAAKYSGAGSTVTVAVDGRRRRGRHPHPRRRTRASRRRRPAACSSCSTGRPARPAAAGGAGIGLFVCARLIAAMGGRIWALPRPDGGAEFGFALRVLHE